MGEPSDLSQSQAVRAIALIFFQKWAEVPTTTTGWRVPLPNYLAHVTINLAALVAGTYAAAALYDVPAPYVVLGGASFTAATFLLSPDLDLRYSNPAKNWGPMRWLWFPYQALSKHRGLSHNLLLSTFTRVAYLVIVGVLIAAALNTGLASIEGSETSIAIAATANVAHTFFRHSESLLAHHREHIAAVGVGLWLSDVVHILADRLLSAFKALAKI